MAETIWQQRPDRHYRRYTNEARYPYLLHWGNSRLTTPAKMRTYWGARFLAALWLAIGRRHLWIEKRDASVGEPTAPHSGSKED